MKNKKPLVIFKGSALCKHLRICWPLFIYLPKVSTKWNVAQYLVTNIVLWRVFLPKYWFLKYVFGWFLKYQIRFHQFRPIIMVFNFLGFQENYQKIFHSTTVFWLSTLTRLFLKRQFSAAWLRKQCIPLDWWSST